MWGMPEVLVILAAVLAALGGYRLLRRRAHPASPPEDPHLLVPAYRRGGPRGRSGAVALEEPDDN